MSEKEEQFLRLLKQELVPALGCTEPIAIAFAAAKARTLLSEFPKRVEIYVSNNIVKNVKSVTVPFTNGLKGIDVACNLGIVAGDADMVLEVLSKVTTEDVEKTRQLCASEFCKIFPLKSASNLHIIVKAFNDVESSEVEVKDEHGNIVRMVKDGKVLFEKLDNTESDEVFEFSLKDVFNFVKDVDVDKIFNIIEMQIRYNVAIAEEGIKGDYGQKVGKTLIANYPNDVNLKAKAYAAAGSDARMNGCTMPVIINSGSGNQGITLSVPIYVFAKEYHKSQNSLIKAVLLSNLVSIYIKKGIGKLSAFCGAVSASCGVAAGLTYLMDGNFDKISKAITNTVGNVSGIVCDGAKSSCAAKISSSVDAGIMAYYMAMNDNAFEGGDGIIDKSIEGTIKNVSRLGKDGMRETDDEIISIMLSNKR